MKKRKEIKNLPIRENADDNLFARLFSNQKIVALLILSFTILLLFPLAKSYSQRKVIEKEINELKAESEKYQQGNEELNEFLSYINSNQAVEEQARTSLNLKKSGEGVIIIEELSEEEKDAIVKQNEENQKSNFQKWFSYFFS